MIGKLMRYHYEPQKEYISTHGKLYLCDHPVYSRCTLYLNEKKGLAVIQQRCLGKQTYWSDIDPWVANDIYMHPGFKDYFEVRSGYPKYGIYPTVTIRQIMWGLKMKPLRRERWETYFDRKEI